MTRAAREAHLRLSASLPRHTHEWRPPVIQPGVWGRRRTPEELEAMKAEMAIMRSRGMKNREIRAYFGCNNRMIIHLIGRRR